jgi:hypothetical protein
MAINKIRDLNIHQHIKLKNTKILGTLNGKEKCFIIYSIKHHVYIWEKAIIRSDIIWKKWQFKVTERWFLVHIVVLCPELRDIKKHVLGFCREPPFFKNPKLGHFMTFMWWGETGEEDFSCNTYVHIYIHTYIHMFHGFSSVSQR